MASSVSIKSRSFLFLQDLIAKVDRGILRIECEEGLCGESNRCRSVCVVFSKTISMRLT